MVTALMATITTMVMTTIIMTMTIMTMTGIPSRRPSTPLPRTMAMSIPTRTPMP